jgi:hypothetical protein
MCVYIHTHTHTHTLMAVFLFLMHKKMENYELVLYFMKASKF